MGASRQHAAGQPPPSLANCFTCQSRNKSEWCSLADDDLRILNGNKICNLYKAGQVVFYQGNPCLGVYCIDSGTVAIRKTDEHGNSILSRLASGGQTLGYRTFFEGAGAGYSSSAEALTDAKICFVDRRAVQELLSRNPNLGLQFLKHMANDLRESEEHSLQTAALPIRLRFVHLLLSLKDRYATVDDDGALRIDLPLSRQDMAAMLGTRPETVARVVKALSDDGIARFEGRVVSIPDLDDLLDEIEQHEAA